MGNVPDLDAGQCFQALKVIVHVLLLPGAFLNLVFSNVGSTLEKGLIHRSF
jgi:hypothetical protein